MGYEGGIGSGKEGDEQIHLFHGMLCYLNINYLYVYIHSAILHLFRHKN